jgi:hypothetical protein
MRNSFYYGIWNYVRFEDSPDENVVPFLTMYNFFNCGNASNVYLGNTVKKIKNYSFYGRGAQGISWGGVGNFIWSYTGLLKIAISPMRETAIQCESDVFKYYLPYVYCTEEQFNFGAQGPFDGISVDTYKTSPIWRGTLDDWQDPLGPTPAETELENLKNQYQAMLQYYQTELNRVGMNWIAANNILAGIIANFETPEEMTSVEYITVIEKEIVEKEVEKIIYQTLIEYIEGETVTVTEFVDRVTIEYQTIYETVEVPVWFTEYVTEYITEYVEGETIVITEPAEELHDKIAELEAIIKIYEEHIEYVTENVFVPDPETIYVTVPEIIIEYLDKIIVEYEDRIVEIEVEIDRLVEVEKIIEIEIEVENTEKIDEQAAYIAYLENALRNAQSGAEASKTLPVTLIVLGIIFFSFCVMGFILAFHFAVCGYKKHLNIRPRA